MTDEFFESCVFDLLASADDKLARLTNHAFLDFNEMMPKTSRSATGRQELEEYDSNLEHPVEPCRDFRSVIPHDSSAASPNVNCSHMLPILSLLSLVILTSLIR